MAKVVYSWWTEGVVYKPGKENSVADALSRQADATITMAISSPMTQLWDEIAEATRQDEGLRAKANEIPLQENNDSEWEMHRGCVLHHGRVLIPPVYTLRNKILHEFHDSVTGGHSGIFRTYQRVKRLFEWQGMRRDIENYVKSCDVCQRNKSDSRSPAGLLAPLPVPKKIWTDISMDFVNGLPRSQGKDSILVVVDRMSKYAHFIPLSHPYSAKEVAEAFIRGVVKLHGIPESIVSDRDRIFVSNFWQELFKLQGTQLKMSSSYHPQTDGQTEVVNRCLEQYLRCFVYHQPRQWEKFLSCAEYWYNTTYHQSIDMTPFEAVYGRPVPRILNHEHGSTAVNEVDVQLRDRDALLRELKVNLEAAQNRMK